MFTLPVHSSNKLYAWTRLKSIKTIEIFPIKIGTFKNTQLASLLTHRGWKGEIRRPSWRCALLRFRRMKLKRSRLVILHEIENVNIYPKKQNTESSSSMSSSSCLIRSRISSLVQSCRKASPQSIFHNRSIFSTSSVGERRCNSNSSSSTIEGIVLY